MRKNERKECEKEEVSITKKYAARCVEGIYEKRKEKEQEEGKMKNTYIYQVLRPPRGVSKLLLSLSLEFHGGKCQSIYGTSTLGTTLP